MSRQVYRSGRSPRLPRVTGQLAQPDPDAAIREAAETLAALAASKSRFVLFFRIGERGSIPLEIAPMAQVARLEALGLVTAKGGVVSLTKRGHVAWVGVRGIVR